MLSALIRILLLTSALALDASAADGSGRPAIYDEAADGGEQIAAAVTTAHKDNRHILLQFGANWCGWCHRLHHLFETDKDVREYLRENYVLVLVDVNEGHNEATMKKYGQDAIRGLPSLAVLDADGKLLTNQETGSLEKGDAHDPEKVLAFLKKWAPAAEKP